MFGYIRPLKCELKMCEYDSYRAAYCGLCNALSSRCGFLARFIVNYDFTFIALIFSDVYGAEKKTVKRRCIVCPKGRMCHKSGVYDTVADISVILTYLKFCDNISDNTFIKSLFSARIPRVLLRGAYKKASKKLGNFATESGRLFDELVKLEKEKCPSIDETADKFAKMLGMSVCGEDSISRILKAMLYHIGRFVYIIDALDDFEEDIAHGGYNPISERFKVFSGVLPDSVKTEIIETLSMSKSAVLSAYELLPHGENEGIIRNIIELGMANSVFKVINKEKK